MAKVHGIRQDEDGSKRFSVKTRGGKVIAYDVGAAASRKRSGGRFLTALRQGMTNGLGSLPQIYAHRRHPTTPKRSDLQKVVDRLEDSADRTLKRHGRKTATYVRR